MRSAASPQSISDLIGYWGRWFNVSPRLARAVFSQESGLNPNVADSSAGAQGIAQIMPATQRLLGITDPYDVNQSIRGGIQYLRQGYDTAIAAGHSNPAAAAVRYYNPLGGRDYLQNVAARYAALPDEQATVQGQPGGGAGPGSGAPAGQTAGFQPPWGPAALVPPIVTLLAGVAADSGVSRGPAPRFGVSSEVMNYPGVPQGTALNRVDPRLVDIATRASGYLPDGWRAEMISGWRGGPTELQHGLGRALDIQLYDQNGNAIPNVASGADFRTYEAYMQKARKLQQVLYPELEGRLSWGGYFGSGAKTSADLMHLSLDEPGSAGDWAGGLNQRYRGVYDRGGQPSQGMGEVGQFQLPSGFGNVAIAPHPSGVGVTAVSLPDQAPASGRRLLPGVQIASAADPAASQLPPVAHYQPADWRAAGAPPSMAEAPPSAFAGVVGTTPEQAERYRQVSTPEGYAAALRALAAAPSGSAMPAVERTPLPPPPAAPPVPFDLEPQRGRGLAASPLTVMPNATVLPADGQPPDQPGYSDLEPQRGRAPGAGPALAMPLVRTPQPLPVIGTGLTPPVPEYGGSSGFSAFPGAAGAAVAPAGGAARLLSDEEIARMGPNDAAMAGLRNELTEADRMALIQQLSQFQQQQQMW
jgi:hypothetical protein